ncbi:MAG: NUDIX hydrolase [Candidatus Kapaibacteriota bacterium]|jgi:ADP-ribose pyrophosphatase
MIYRWDTISVIKKEFYKIFEIGLIEKKHEKSNVTSQFTKIFSLNWVNIIPITAEGKVILIEQFRHGTDEFTIEIPGGLIEEVENPIFAAKRECEEETGYSSEIEPIFLGLVEPNPAFMDNKCYTFLWEGCKFTKPQNFDEHEEINVMEVGIDEVFEMVKNGKINHSIVLNALFYYKLYLENQKN